jgi:hypothetical protein
MTYIVVELSLGLNEVQQAHRVDLRTTDFAPPTPSAQHRWLRASHHPRNRCEYDLFRRAEERERVLLRWCPTAGKCCGLAKAGFAVRPGCIKALARSLGRAKLVFGGTLGGMPLVSACEGGGGVSATNEGAARPA